MFLLPSLPASPLPSLRVGTSRATSPGPTNHSCTTFRGKNAMNARQFDALVSLGIAPSDRQHIPVIDRLALTLGRASVAFVVGSGRMLKGHQKALLHLSRGAISKLALYE